MKCLLIDDNPVDLLVNERVMSSCFDDLEIVKAQSGEEALQYLDKGEPLPEIILLDINMPFMNGFEFLQEYRRYHQPEYSKIKIYILSSSLDPDDIHKADQEERVKAFLQKPLKMEEVRSKIIDAQV